MIFFLLSKCFKQFIKKNFLILLYRLGIDSHLSYTPYAATTTSFGHRHCHHYHHYLLLLLLGPFLGADERKEMKRIE